MNTAQILKDSEDRMDKAVDVFRNELKGLRTGRANPAMLDPIRVDYYGSPTPIKQIANVSSPDPSSLMIKPFSADDLKEIEKAIRGSDLGLAPNNDGKVIRLNIPQMSGDQRKKIVQQLKKSAESAKVSCRNIRRDANKHFDDAEKAGEMTEDERDKGKDKVQAQLKAYETKVDDLADKKSKEILEG
ncbi:MAG: ribosome recycling factor [Bacteroidales bacterium]|nr:ribosome recycling factor [Bacteroidales bacterium]